VNLKLRMITVLVVDLRGFTEIAAGISTVQLAEMMRGYFREVGEVLERRGAWAQKYIGDAVMAIWVHEPRQPQAPVMAAVDSLIRIQAIASGLQRRFQLEHAVRIGAGINTGFASIGNIGSSAFADYTALGETVIKAFRLEKCTRDVESEVVLGRETASELQQIAGHKFLTESKVLLKGYPDFCRVYATDVRKLVMELGSEQRAVCNPTPALQSSRSRRTNRHMRRCALAMLGLVLPLFSQTGQISLLGALELTLSRHPQIKIGEQLVETGRALRQQALGPSDTLLQGNILQTASTTPF
jgi:class 3 adenylate cyclase